MSASEPAAVNNNSQHQSSPSKDKNVEKVGPINGGPITTATPDASAAAVAQKVNKETINETTKNGQVLATSKSASNIGKSMNVLRERSFIRPTNPQMIHPALFMADHPMHQKRRSFGHQLNYQMASPPQYLSAAAIQHHHPQQLRGKPELEIYRPPNVRMDGGARNKLNIHAQEFTMALPVTNSYPQENLMQSKSGGNLHYAMNNRNLLLQQMNQFGGHPQRATQSKLKTAHLPSSQMPLVTSPSMGNVLQPSVARVKFAPEPQILHHPQQSQPKGVKPSSKSNLIVQPPPAMPLQRSKSLSSADTIARGLAGLGFALGGDIKDVGNFPPEQQLLIDVAIQDPNQLNARDLMELATVALRRAVEARRYALPLSQLCITIVAKERKETFLEALLNTCRQWYQEREKILGPAINSRNPSRPRFTAFMAFLTEMFCQLKRRQLQLRTVCDGVPPPMVLLTVLFKCCEDCVRPSVRSLSEIECLFYVLTCIGLDLENHLPEQLDGLLASVRDAFLNSNASAPAIRRTLLQLIELQASHWQLPGNTVLYYYPSK